MSKKKTSNLEVPKNALSPEFGKNITTIEYVCLMMGRIGSQFGTTLTGTLAAAFLYELYFSGVDITTEQIGYITGIQTTLTTILGIVAGFVSAMVVQKWKTKWGRYRHWYIICLLPMFFITIFYFYVPSGWKVYELTLLRYGIACCQCIFNAFNAYSQHVTQVISPNPKEKKTVATMWQLSYYVGYGGAYIATFIYGEIYPDDKNGMYMTLAIVAASVTFVGNLMCGLFCKERIELPQQKKAKVSKTLLTLFKDRNYRAYQFMQWANTLAMLGKMSTLLAAITVGSSKNLLLTLPTAVGTVVGNLITSKLSKKYEPTKLLKFCGPFSIITAGALFATCFIEAKMGLVFFQNWNSVFFYALYFIFGVGIGVQELSNSHFNVEYYDYLEWKTGERMEAVQGIIPGWVTSGLNYLKDLMIPFMIAWVHYPKSDEEDLLKTAQNLPNYMEICLWILAFLLFGYAIANLLKSIILKTMYDVEGDKKKQMYAELEVMRAKRHIENQELSKKN